MFWRASGAKTRNFGVSVGLARPARTCPDPARSTIIVAGLFSTASGLGEAARSTYRALCAAGYRPLAVDLSEKLALVDMESGIDCVEMPRDGEGILILQVNAPETAAALRALGVETEGQWYVIGYWAWELPDFPAGWDSAFRFVSEIWTVSEFSAKALRAHPRSPAVHVFGHAISVPALDCTGRDQFSLPGDATVFLVMADSLSSMQRKNPFAAISAFREAFGEDDSRLLLVKTRNLAAHPEAEADLLASIAGASNIRIIDQSLSDMERWCIIDAADVMVSLHRSEGFGLVIAEAMALGKPVITTGWSGVEDFADSETACPVGFRIVPCEDQYGIYRDSGSSWAEADIGEAAELMRRTADDAGLRQTIGGMAQARIRERFSPESIGRAMRQRLEEASRQASDPAGG